MSDENPNNINVEIGSPIKSINSNSKLSMFDKLPNLSKVASPRHLVSDLKNIEIHQGMPNLLFPQYKNASIDPVQIGSFSNQGLKTSMLRAQNRSLAQRGSDDNNSLNESDQSTNYNFIKKNKAKKHNSIL